MVCPKCVQKMSKMCPTIWTNFGHILDTVWTFQITLGTCHEDVQKLSKSFGHFIPLWTLFGQVLDKFWTHHKVGHMLDTFWTCFGHLSTLWTHFGHFYVQNVSVPTSFTSPVLGWWYQDHIHTQTPTRICKNCLYCR